MSKKLKLGLVLPALPGYSETFIYNKIDGLLKQGFKIKLFISNQNNHQRISYPYNIYSQVNINNKIYVFFRLFFSFLFHPKVCLHFLILERQSNRIFLESIKNLIINLHIIDKKVDWLHFGFANEAVGRENVASAIGAKLAVSLRGSDISIFPYKYHGCYRVLWHKVNKVHAISDDLYNKALDIGLRKKIYYKKINPAIDINYFSISSKMLTKLNHPLRILTVGRLKWKKGYEYALYAMYLLKKEKIQFKYHIVGKGDDYEKIIYMLNYLELTDCVKLHGSLPKESVKSQLNWADIYLQPSIQEGFCNSVLEAQAMGLLCIVTNAEGLSENVINNKTGWVVPRRSSKAIKQKIIEVINKNPNYNKKIKENAIKRVNQKFNLDDQIINWKNFYLK